MMASSSANVEAPPMAGVQVTEGPLAAEVPAGVFFPHPGALSSNTGAVAEDTNAASAGDINADALCELLPVKLGIGDGPCWPPAIHPRSPSSKEGINGGDRRSQLVSHLLLDYLQNLRHFCLEFFNLALLAFRAGLSLLSPNLIVFRPFRGQAFASHTTS